MTWNSLFRKKSVHDILEQVRVADQNSDAHALGKHLKVRDLAAFGIAAIIGAGIIPVAMEFMDKPAIAICEAFAKAGYPLDVEAMLIIEVEGNRRDFDDIQNK